jgi:SAM-dependent methyltransferase
VNSVTASTESTPQKRAVREHFDRLAPEMPKWRRKSWYYHRELERLCRHLVPAGASVLEIGCGTGELLAALEPSKGVGIDLSPAMIAQARAEFPGLTWEVGDAEQLTPGRTFDYIILSDLVGHLEDIWAAFQCLKPLARPDTRVVITYYNYLWEPLLHAAEAIGQRMPLRLQNWLPPGDIENLLYLCDFEVVKRGRRFLVPKYVPLLSEPINRIVATLPLVRQLCLIEYFVARPWAGELPAAGNGTSSSIVIPCRNERGNIAAAIERTPPLGSATEIIFVDGASTDGTKEEIERQIEIWKGRKDVRLVLQPAPKGKGEAVRLGFDAARHDILFILDADLTVPPEDLPKFHQAIVEGKGEMMNGSRLVYPMESQAMRFLNLLGNKFFSLLFTWMLEQRITDTLCGTKVVRQRDYRKIKANRAYFGDFDPFGDFDLLFGAARLNLKICDLPIRYRDRTYGTTKISRFRHGLLLFRMSWVAFRKLKLG